MATTFVDYTGNGVATKPFSFPSLAVTDVKVEVDGVLKTVTTHYNITSYTTTGGGNVVFTSGNIPASPAAIRIYRDTDVATGSGEYDPQATYAAGSSVKAADLNLNQKQALYAIKEEKEQTITTTDIKDGAVTSAKIFDGTIATADLADGSVTSAKIADATIVTADLANGAVNNAKIADASLSTTKYQDGTITTAKIADDAITSAKIADDQITNALIADDQIDSEHYVDGSIDTAHIADSQITSAKIADGTIVGADIANGAVNNAQLADASISTTKYQDATITTAKIVDANVTQAKLANSAVGTAQIASDAVDGTKIADDAINSEHYTDGSIDTAHIADANVTLAKVENVTDGQIIIGNGSNRPTAQAVSGDVTIANTGAVTIASNAVEIGMIGCEQTTITDSDSHIPTSGAVVDYVASIVNPIGGLEVIADDESFPNTIPAAGVVISITDAAGLTVNSSGVSTNADALDNSTITINGFPSELRGGVGSNPDPYVFQSGAGLMVVSTGSSQTYNYHQALIRESDFVQLSDDINDFNNRYRIHNGEPSSNNDDGDLVWDTNANKMKVYDGTASAWSEVTSTGDFKFLVPVDAGTTTAATWDGSDTSFDLKEATNTGSAASITNVNQLLISLNGVIQKPNTGSYNASEEGFYLTDTDTIRFCTAPPTGSTAFILQIGSAVSIPTPGDATVTTAKIADGAVSTAKLGADAVDGTKLADNAVNSEHYTDGSIDVEHLADNSIDEASLYISNAGSNGQFLQKQSGVTGGLTWATVDLTAATDYADNVKIRFGTGNDLEIFHDSSHSYISEVGTGNLYIRSEGLVQLGTITGTEACLNAYANGAVELYHDNSNKLQTTASGINVTGTTTDDGADHAGDVIFQGDGANTTWDKSADTLKFNDNAYGKWGTGGDLSIYHDGSSSAILNDTGQLTIASDNALNLCSRTGTEYFFRGYLNGGVELYYDNVRRLSSTSYGVEIVGDLEFNSDSAKIKLGADDDLKIYHDGTNGYLDNKVGGLWLRTNDTEYSIKCFANSQVELYHDNTKKLETTAAGVTVSGSVTDDKGDVRKIIQNSQGGAYTLVATDSGKHIFTANNVTWADSVFAAGDAVTIVNNSGSNITITKGTNMYNTSDATNANRTLAGRGMATLLFTAADTCYISGSGLS